MRRGKYYYVYIVASINRIIYVGFTDCLVTRIQQHKNGTYANSFSRKYKTNRLVYWEQLVSEYAARKREIEIKKWRREKKVLLIERDNPQWRDRYIDVIELGKSGGVLY